MQYGTGRIETAELSKKLETREDSGYANGSLLDDSFVEEASPGQHAIIKSSTISKEDLVLIPNGNSTPKTPSIPRNRSYDSLKREFELGDCLDYVHAGMEAIIEDEVTQRFVAEELKVCWKSILTWLNNVKLIFPSFYSLGIC